MGPRRIPSALRARNPTCSVVAASLDVKSARNSQLDGVSPNVIVVGPDGTICLDIVHGSGIELAARSMASSTALVTIARWAAVLIN